jgi:thiamine-phosphate pyrophosphorylase
MKLLAISRPDFISDEARIINGLFREELEYMHVRKPGCTTAELEALLSEIDKAYISRIVIHQHHELAPAFGITRLHLTEAARNNAAQNEFENLKKQGFTLSTSVHTPEEIADLSTSFSYTFYGPVFDSISKSGYKSTLTKDFILGEKYKTVPVIGLGGINISNLGKVKDMNFDGAAVLGILWQNPCEAIEVFRSLSKIVRQ